MLPLTDATRNKRLMVPGAVWCAAAKDKFGNTRGWVAYWMGMARIAETRLRKNARGCLRGTVTTVLFDSGHWKIEIQGRGVFLSGSFFCSLNLPTSNPTVLVVGTNGALQRSTVGVRVQGGEARGLC